MKKILNEWKKLINEQTDQDRLLNKVRDIFFGAYNSWEPEYTMLHDEKFEENFAMLKKEAEEKFDNPEKRNKVIRGANIGLSLYWSDNVNHGAGSAGSAEYIIRRKLDILESFLSDDEKNKLKSGLMEQIIDSVRKDRSNVPYPEALAVSSGVINGKPVDDAYMTTEEAMVRFVIPVLRSKGYYTRPTKTTKPTAQTTKRREKPMDLADMMAQMKKFGRR